MHAARGLLVGRETVLELASESYLIRVLVLNCQPAERPVLPHHVHDAPVGEAGHRETRHVRQRLAVVEGGGEDCAGGGKEAQLLFGPLSPGTLLDLAKHALYHRDQALQSVFEHVVSGSLVQAHDGPHFVFRTRDEDEWDLRVGLACGLQRGRAIERRKRILCKDDVEITTFQGTSKFVARLDPSRLAGETALCEGRLDELRILRVIFQKEDAQPPYIPRHLDTRLPRRP